MKPHWLQNNIRRFFLTYRFYYLPLLLGNKAIAEVYLSLNDPHSFMLVQMLPDIEKRFNITFKLYLVADTTPASEVDTTRLKFWTLKSANAIADKHRLIKVNTFPNINALVTGQQTWISNVKSTQDALKVFNDTWFDKYQEHFPFSTPLITAQLKNKRRLLRKGHYTSASILFCGEWLLGVDSLEHLAFLLNEKNLLNDNVAIQCEENQLQEESNIETFVSYK